MFTQIERVFRHRWLSLSSSRQEITPDMMERLRKGIAASETRHSGEIRIFVETALPNSYLWRDLPIKQLCRDRALSIFRKLNVWDTEQNNGVLIYLLLAEHAIEVVADRGLHQRATPHLWQDMTLRMQTAFQQGQFEDGLTQALGEVSALLVEHFSIQPGQKNPNELPDSLVLN